MKTKQQRIKDAQELGYGFLVYENRQLIIHVPPIYLDAKAAKAAGAVVRNNLINQGSNSETLIVRPYEL